MDTKQQRELDALERVQSYLDAHVELSGLKGTSLRGNLDTAVSSVQAQRATQGTSALQLEGVGTRQTAMAESLKTQHMEPIARYARVRLKGVPDIGALTVSVKNLRGPKLVAKAQAMAAAAEQHSADMTQVGFPADAVSQLQQAAAALNQAIQDRVAATRAKTESTAGIRQQLLAGRDAVRMLDAVVVKTLAGNAALLAGWRQAKRVTKKGVPEATAAAVPTVGPSGATPTPAATQPSGTQEVKAA